MKLKKYNEFVNEELNLGSLFKAASGTLKSFLNSLSEPFKNLKDEFKKGLSFEKAKEKILDILDDILKSSTDGINKAKDEKEIDNINASIDKQIAEKIEEFEKEIVALNESVILNESMSAMIGGRVLLTMISSTIKNGVEEFKKKYAEAKTLDDKKKVAIENIKNIIDESKKKIGDEKFVRETIEKYKKEKNIKTTKDDVLKSYGVKAKEELVNKTVYYKPKKGYDDNKKPIEQLNIIQKRKVTKIDGDNMVLIDKRGKAFKKPMEDLLPNIPTADLIKTIAPDDTTNNNLDKVISAIKNHIKDDNKIDTIIANIEKIK